MERNPYSQRLFVITDPEGQSRLVYNTGWKTETPNGWQSYVSAYEGTQHIVYITEPTDIIHGISDFLKLHDIDPSDMGPENRTFAKRVLLKSNSPLITQVHSHGKRITYPEVLKLVAFIENFQELHHDAVAPEIAKPEGAYLHEQETPHDLPQLLRTLREAMVENSFNKVHDNSPEDMILQYEDLIYLCLEGIKVEEWRLAESRMLFEGKRKRFDPSIIGRNKTQEENHTPPAELDS